MFQRKIQQKNATFDDEMKSFEGSLELFKSVGKAYIVAALLQFFERDDINNVWKQCNMSAKFTKVSKNNILIIF